MTIEIPRFLTKNQADLVRETEPHRMEALDEDTLLDLHTRVRRARSKYVKLYRQTGAQRVGMKGARGHARPGNAANGAKAEVFELALARVSALWPATILQHHPHPTVLLDPAAAGRLQLAGYYRETFAGKPTWQGI